MICPANVGSMNELRIASRLSAKNCGVQGDGENDRKFSGVLTSVQRSYNVMFWKISS